MDAAEDRARSQIMAIEQVHGIKFLNRDEIARLIVRSMVDDNQVLMVCTAINLWAAGNRIKGEVRIPEDLVENVMNIKRQRFSSNPRKAGKKKTLKGEKD